MLACNIEAELNPDVAGPIKANGAMKHPDKVTPTATIRSNLLNIESPFLKTIVHCLETKKRVKVTKLSQPKVEINFLNLLFF